MISSMDSSSLEPINLRCFCINTSIITYYIFLRAEEASLSLTKEFQPDDLEDITNLMFSIATYVAENSETLNLAEGERLYVIGMWSNIVVIFIVG